MKRYDLFTIKSKYLHREVRVFVLTPKNYDEKKDYPVMYMHDGHNLFDNETATFGTSWGIVENYEEHSDLPDVIFVGMDCKEGLEGISRIIEYSPYAPSEYTKKRHIDAYVTKLQGVSIEGQGHDVLNMIVKEVKPIIDEKYSTKPEAFNTGLGGSSMGGLLTTYGAIHFQDYFSRFMSMSNAYFYNGDMIVEDMKKSDLSNVEKFYMDCGTAETSGDEHHKVLYIDYNNQVYNVAKSKLTEDRLMYILEEGGTHSETDWKRRFPKAIKFLFEC